MPLNRTTTRALAASVALVAAGGTVAGAAVFHLPILGFGAANAGASSAVVRTVADVRPAAKIAPIRVVRTRYVDQIVHQHRGAAASRATAPQPSAPVAAASPTAAPTTPPTSTDPVTNPPVVDPPTSNPPVVQPPEPPDSGDGHDGDGSEDHGGHGDHHGDDDSPTTTAPAAQ